MNDLHIYTGYPKYYISNINFGPVEWDFGIDFFQKKGVKGIDIFLKIGGQMCRAYLPMPL